VRNFHFCERVREPQVGNHCYLKHRISWSREPRARSTTSFRVK